ncbi:MAG: cellulose biosynthesis protein BcsS [Nitrosospira sp.]|nr:cellulose biosynthesis protein BcsS [Nitrosospira sp.]
MHVLFKLILAIPWLGLMAPSLVAAEPVTHRDYYSIQVLTGTPAVVRNAWQKVLDLPFARIEKHVGQHKLRIGYWSSKQEAENQLAGMKKHFPRAFVFATEYKPGEILLGWSADAAKSPGKPANTGEQQPIAITSGLVKSLPAASNVVSATAGGAIGSVPATSNIVSAAAGRLASSPSTSSNIVSLQKNTQLGATVQPDIAAPEESHAASVELPVPAPSLTKTEVAEPARKQQVAMPDETLLWQLLQNEQYDALQAGIERMRASHGKWQPPQELLSLLQQGRLRQKIEQAIHSKDSAALIQLAELHPEDFACAHVDWAWALAEAQVALKQTDAAHLILQRLIPYCGEQDRLATLYKAKAWLDTPMWEALLEREAQAIRSDEGESKFRRLRYDHGMEKLLAAHQAQNQAAFRVLLQQLGDDIEHYHDADAALLSGWHYFNAQEAAIADIWFGKALTWNPEQHDARSGLALSALQGKRFADAKRLADALPVGSKGRQELLNTVATAMAPGPRVLAMTGGETNTGTTYSALYAGMIMPIHNRLGGLGNGMVQRLWVDRLTYAYDNGGQQTQAEQRGIEGSLGYQKSGPWGSWATFAGVVYRDTQFTPDALSNPARGGFVRGRFQIEGERILNKDWRVNINANYVTGQNSYWARGRLLYNLNERMLTGPEAIVLGDPNFQIKQYGWAMTGLRVLLGTDVTMRGGAREAVDGTTMYLGLELARPF